MTVRFVAKEFRRAISCMDCSLIQSITLIVTKFRDFSTNCVCGRSIDSGSVDNACRNGPGAIPQEALININFSSIIVATVSARFRFQQTRLIQSANGAIATSPSPVLIPIEQGKLP